MPTCIKKPHQDAIFSRHSPKQTAINKILKVIQSKALKDYHLPIHARELKKEQSLDPNFKDIILYIDSKVLACKKEAQRRVIRESESHITIEGIMFRISVTSDKEDCKLTLCIPECLTPRMINQYHDSLLSCHQGVSRTYQTMRKLFYMSTM